MKKQKNKYTTTKIIAVITILLFLVFLFKNRLLEFTAIYPTVPQEVFNRNIVSRDITQNILTIKQFLDNVKLPEERGSATYIRDMVENALNAWIECQELVNIKKVNVLYRSGELYMTDYDNSTTNMHYLIVLQSEKGNITQCRKTVLPAKTGKNITKQFVYDLHFNEEFNIKSYKDDNGEVSFYPSGLIERILHNPPEGKRHYIRWSEDGNITHYNTYNTD